MRSLYTFQWVTATLVATGLTGGFLGVFYGYLQAMNQPIDNLPPLILKSGLAGAAVGMTFPISIPWLGYRQLTRKA